MLATSLGICFIELVMIFFFLRELVYFPRSLFYFFFIFKKYVINNIETLSLLIVIDKFIFYIFLYLQIYMLSTYSVLDASLGLGLREDTAVIKVDVILTLLEFTV